MGWLSDRVSRRGVIQASLLLSMLATWWLAHQGPGLPLLLLNLVLYGAFTVVRTSSGFFICCTERYAYDNVLRAQRIYTSSSAFAMKGSDFKR